MLAADARTGRRHPDARFPRRVAHVDGGNVLRTGATYAGPSIPPHVRVTQTTSAAAPSLVPSPLQPLRSSPKLLYTNLFRRGDRRQGRSRHGGWLHEPLLTHRATRSRTRRPPPLKPVHIPMMNHLTKFVSAPCSIRRLVVGYILRPTGSAVDAASDQDVCQQQPILRQDFWAQTRDDSRRRPDRPHEPDS
jgi:hypothetical protein